MTTTSNLKIINWIFYILLILFPVAALLLIICQNKDTFEILSLYVAILGLLFGIKMYFEKVIATEKLEKLNNKNIELKEKEIELSQRAEITIESLKGHIVESNKELSFSLELKNNGKSNAMIQKFNFIIIKNNIKEHDCRVNKIYNLSPHDTKTFSPRILEHKFTNALFENGQIEIETNIFYTDSTTKIHKTYGKFKYDSQRNKYSIIDSKQSYNI